MWLGQEKGEGEAEGIACGPELKYKCIFEKSQAESR